jgi:hypothetical protein
MSNPWRVTLKKTGLNEKRTEAEENGKLDLENRQNELTSNALLNKTNKDIYDERQDSLAANAMMGKQDRLGGKKKSKKHRTRKNKKSRKYRKSKTRNRS